ncbi:MAG TPA: hypothetical protein VHO47_01880 [Candidatus Babeliales bacterium]|nr:hypothetical protein [Candidatus Babeliales bacterium]
MKTCTFLLCLLTASSTSFPLWDSPNYPKGIVYKNGVPGYYIRTITISLNSGDEERMVWYPQPESHRTALKNTGNDPIKPSTETTPASEEKNN